MKIPGQAPLQVAPTQAQLPVRSVTQPGGFNALEQGVGQLGQMADTVAAVYEKQKREAEAKDASDLITEKQKRLTDRWEGTVPRADPNAPVPDVTKMSDEGFGDFLAGKPTETTPGFSSVKGEHALAALDDHLKSIDDDTKELAGKARSPQAKKLFEQAAAKLDLQAYQQAKGHVANQLEQAKTLAASGHPDGADLKQKARTVLENAEALLITAQVRLREATTVAFVG